MKNRPSPRPNRPQPPRVTPVNPPKMAASPAAPKPAGRWHKSRWLAALVAVFAFLIYSNTLKHDFANDDLASVNGNRVIQQGWNDLGNVFKKANWYGYTAQNHSILRPFTGFSFATDVKFFGKKNEQQSQLQGIEIYEPNPHAMHFVNVLLYTISCTVLFLALRRILKGRHPLLPLAVALLFAAHPIHTEVVANIKSRDEILSFLFGLAIPLYLLWRYLDTQKPMWWALAIFSYFLGVFSKESAVTFLAVFPLTLFFFTGLPLKRIALLSAPFLVPVALFLAARSAWLDPAPENNRLVIDNVVFAATTTGARLGTISVIMLEYLRLLVFPHPLSWDYSYNQIPVASLANAKALLSVAIHLGLLVLAFVGLRKKRIWSYGIFFYFITMSVYSNLLVPIHATVGERFLFSPSLAFCLVLAHGAFRLLARKKDPETANAPFNYAMVLVAILATVYSFKTVARNKDWKDSLSISKAGAEVAPNSARTRSAYGSALMKLGEQSSDPNAKTAYFREALAETKKAVEIYPNDANFVYNIGVLSYYLNDTATARQMFTRSIELEPTKLNALFNLGATYEKEGNNAMAMKYYQKVQALDSAFQNVTLQIGNTATKLKQHDLAIANLRAHLRRQPNNAEAFNSLGVIYYEKRQLQEAADAFARAAQLAPTRADFYANAGSTYYALGQYAKAAQFYEQALKHNPNEPNYASYLNLSRQLAGQGQ